MVWHILIEHVYSQNASKTLIVKKYVRYLNRNFKMVASVFYYEVIKYLSLNNPIIQNNNIIENDDHLKFKPVEIDKIKDTPKEEKKPTPADQKKKPTPDKKKDTNKSDDKYEKALNQYIAKMKNDKSPENESTLLKDINKKLTVYAPDSKQHAMEFIESHVLTDKEMAQYYKYSKMNNFDLTEMINAWSNKLYNIIVKNSNPDK